MSWHAVVLQMHFAMVMVAKYEEMAKRYWEQAAIGGHNVTARYNLGIKEEFCWQYE